MSGSLFPLALAGAGIRSYTILSRRETLPARDTLGAECQVATVNVLGRAGGVPSSEVRPGE